MKKIEARSKLCLLLALALFLGTLLFVFRYLTSASRWVSYFYTFSGSPSVGRVLDRDGDVLSYVNSSGKRVYYKNPAVRAATLHAVGDAQGRIGSGALSAFSDKLSGYNLFTGTYSPLGQGNDLYLTIDARLNYVAHQAMAGRKGVAAVYNYQTGEVLCMYSAPNFDPANVPDIQDGDPKYEGVYVNRFLGATYPPGSIFKLVTLSAAIETLPNWAGESFTCTGATQVGDELITCQSAHGDLTAKEALAVSCNGYFATLAARLGADTLERYAVQAGLATRYDVSGLPCARGSFDLSDATQGQLGWAGVGQYNDLANPCSLLVYMGAIARGGQGAVPQLILKTETALDLPLSFYLKKRTGRLVEKDTAQALSTLMANNVQVSYSPKRFPNMDICAKSGTAEVGGGKAPHAWFAGFLRDEEHPYAFVFLVENGGSGSQAAGSVAAKVLNALVND